MPSHRSRAVTGRFPAARLTVLLLLSGLSAAALPASPASAQAMPPARAATADPYAGFVTEAARRFDIPELWIRAVMRVESRGEVRAVSPKGAMGLMQIMPATWAEMRSRHALGADPYNPRDNILAGAAYLREMHDRYGSPGFLAAYNAGPGRYEDYRDRGRSLPAETRAYVAMLVPVIGGTDLALPVTVAAADPLAWTHAPLFIVQADGSSAADRSQHDGAPTARSAPPSERASETAAPQTDGLFVGQSSPAVPR
ncbi:MAG: lytic transglycosylase [Sphingobium sp. 32-64-5]|nr:MAG: lytic transglycosylase [Sphingobium sp. 32-64-5]